MARNRRGVLSTFTSIPVMLLLVGSTVSTDAGVGASGINLITLLIAILIVGLLELGIVIYWVTAARRRSEGNRQLAIWLLLPVVGLFMVFAFVGGFTVCGA